MAGEQEMKIKKKDKKKQTLYTQQNRKRHYIVDLAVCIIQGRLDSKNCEKKNCFLFLKSSVNKK